MRPPLDAEMEGPGPLRSIGPHEGLHGRLGPGVESQTPSTHEADVIGVLEASGVLDALVTVLSVGAGILIAREILSRRRLTPGEGEKGAAELWHLGPGRPRLLPRLPLSTADEVEWHQDEWHQDEPPLRLVHHVYLRPGDRLPCPLGDIIHTKGRDEGTGLDLWHV